MTSESDVCRRQILTPKVDPRYVRIKISIMVVYTHNIGIQMKRKELTKTFMMISNSKTPFGLQGFHKKHSALQELLITRGVTLAVLNGLRWFRS